MTRFGEILQEDPKPSFFRGRDFVDHTKRRMTPRPVQLGQEYVEQSDQQFGPPDEPVPGTILDFQARNTPPTITPSGDYSPEPRAPRLPLAQALDRDISSLPYPSDVAVGMAKGLQQDPMAFVPFVEGFRQNREGNFGAGAAWNAFDMLDAGTPLAESVRLGRQGLEYGLAAAAIRRGVPNSLDRNTLRGVVDYDVTDAGREAWDLPTARAALNENVTARAASTDPAAGRILDNDARTIGSMIKQMEDESAGVIHRSLPEPEVDPNQMELLIPGETITPTQLELPTGPTSARLRPDEPVASRADPNTPHAGVDPFEAEENARVLRTTYRTSGAPLTVDEAAEGIRELNEATRRIRGSGGLAAQRLNQEKRRLIGIWRGLGGGADVGTDLARRGTGTGPQDLSFSRMNERLDELQSGANPTAADKTEIAELTHQINRISVANPLVMYHGTLNPDITRMDKTFAGGGAGGNRLTGSDDSVYGNTAEVVGLNYKRGQERDNPAIIWFKDAEGNSIREGGADIATDGRLESGQEWPDGSGTLDWDDDAVLDILADEGTIQRARVRVAENLEAAKRNYPDGSSESWKADKAHRVSGRFEEVAAKVTKIEPRPRGNTYKLEVNADPDEFLEFNTVGYKQHQKVIDRFGIQDEVAEYQSLVDQGREIYATKSGAEMTDAEFDAAEQLGESLQARRAELEAEVSERLGVSTKTPLWSRSHLLTYEQGLLGRHGIPGVKSSEGTQGTTFAVLDDDLIRIVEKYGIAGLLGARLAGGNESDSR